MTNAEIKTQTQNQRHRLNPIGPKGVNKPENMLLSKNGVLKICDFGFARLIGSNPDQRFTDYVSTRWYRAPELLVGDANYSKPVDVWAIGCIFVELITGRPLFTGDTDYETLRQVLQTFFSDDLPEQLKTAFASNPLFQGAPLPLSPELEVDFTVEGKLAFLNCNAAISFARECLRLDPRQRPTCDELMAHEYFNEFREWFEDEIQTLIEYDTQEANQVITGLGRGSVIKPTASLLPQQLFSNQHSLSRQQINYNQLSVDYEEAKISARGQPGSNSVLTNPSYMRKEPQPYQDQQQQHDVLDNYQLIMNEFQPTNGSPLFGKNFLQESNQSRQQQMHNYHSPTTRHHHNTNNGSQPPPQHHNENLIFEQKEQIG